MMRPPTRLAHAVLATQPHACELRVHGQRETDVRRSRPRRGLVNDVEEEDEGPK